MSGPGAKGIGTLSGSWSDIQDVIFNAIDNEPRTLQRALGPSEVGTGCDACLVCMLAGLPKRRGRAWLPWIGTAVHARLESAFMAANSDYPPDRPRWLTESTLYIGDVAGVPMYGHGDLYDQYLGEPTDFKIVGKSTRQSVKRHGPAWTYYNQINLYGLGYERLGLPVNRLRILYLPREALDIREAINWTVPYDRAVALHALHRANWWADYLNHHGVEAALALAGDHTMHEFSCDRYAVRKALSAADLATMSTASLLGEK